MYEERFLRQLLSLENSDPQFYEPHIRTLRKIIMDYQKHAPRGGNRSSQEWLETSAKIIPFFPQEDT
ncbi:hypothetical protein [Thermopetrobacter sp. TC1]|uniref:hypothetical protein n=1 Tax=Thermopetrobacter sp. TC1 TaxID=1495045 RepID=UPI0012E0AA7B|nr:hypothetical protein [Thermopetrobacter sp. TC1]